MNTDVTTAMEQIIQLAADDDITSIRSRLEWAEARRVLLVIPGRNTTLRNLVNLKILARTADYLNIDLALVTQNLQTRDLAKEAGIKTFASEALAQSSAFVSREAEKLAPQKTAPPQLRLVNKPAVRRVRIKGQKLVLVVGSGRVNIWQQLGALIMVGPLAVALVVMVLALSPTAKVTLVPEVDTVSTQLIVTADPAAEVATVDEENNIIPAQAVQVELTIFDEVETIDTEAAPVGFAAGTVTFLNRTQDQQTIPVSTTVRTSSGVPVDFLTTQEVTVPPGTGATASVPVVAVEPGRVGNVAAGQITRFGNPTLSLLVRVINEASTGGGTVRQAGVVTENDKDRLRSKLRQVIQQKGYEMILANLDEQMFVPPESLQVIELDLTYNQFAGDVADKLGAEMRAVVRATAVGSFDANRLAYGLLLQQVPPGQRLLDQGLQFSAGGVEAFDDRSVTFPVIAKGLTVHQIDIGQARRGIRFKPLGEAQVWLSQNLPIVTVPGVEVSPNWLGRMPLFPFMIDVEVADVEEILFGSAQ